MSEKDLLIRLTRAKMRLAALLALAAALAFVGIVWAQDVRPPTDDQVNDVARELYCPVGENITLDICPTQACAQWRDLIRKQLAEGRSKDDIKNYFAEQYGDQVLAAPPLKGIHWLFYGLLGAFLSGAVVIYLRVVQNMKKRKDSAQRNVADHPDAKQEVYLKQIEEALQRRERNG